MGQRSDRTLKASRKEKFKGLRAMLSVAWGGLKRNQRRAPGGLGNRGGHIGMESSFENREIREGGGGEQGLKTF